MTKRKRTIRDVIIMIVFAVIAFFSLTYASRKIANQHSTSDIVMAVKEVPEYTEITKENVKEYFKKVNVNDELITDDTIKDTDDVIGYFTKEKIRANFPIVKDQLSTKKDELSQYEKPFEGSFAVSAFSDAASGRIRKGDFVKIYAYDDSVKELIEVNSTPIYIANVYDSAGVEIAADDNVTTAVSFNYYIEESEQIALMESLAGKTLSVLKVK